jgi:flagellar motor protein MotB
MKQGLLAALLVAVLVGCNQGPFGTGAQLRKLQGEYAMLVEQNRDLAQRNSALDRDNQEHAKLLAQTHQQFRERDATLELVRQQLKDVSTRLATVQQEKRDADRKVESLLASTRRGGGATIRANTSLGTDLPQFASADVRARADGDVVRVSIPAALLFAPYSTQWVPGGVDLLNSVAGQLARRYPQHLVGLEGHTDSDPVQGGNHQLSLAQATAVFEQLSNNGWFPPAQMFVVGHGPNHPLYSNAAPEGKAANRRIDLVVYPETASGGR